MSHQDRRRGGAAQDPSAPSKLTSGTMKSRVTSTNPARAWRSSDARFAALAKHQAAGACASAHSVRARVSASPTPVRRCARSTTRPTR